LLEFAECPPEAGGDEHRDRSEHQQPLPVKLLVQQREFALAVRPSSGTATPTNSLPVGASNGTLISTQARPAALVRDPV
jgi:hypothetical protein